MELNFKKGNGLLPAIIQDANTLQVLMLGYMNQTAFEKTKKEKKVTFFSRSKNRLWTKGEQSGNYLEVVELSIDCDNDTILVLANPNGPTCHTGSQSCFNNNGSVSILKQLEQTITSRVQNPSEESYTHRLFKKGTNKVAQKFGEEAVECIIEAKDNNKELFIAEAADVLYHFLVLLQIKNTQLSEVEAELKKRMKLQPK